MDRLSGLPVNPPAVQRTEQGYYARVMGDACLVETWLRERRYHQALATGPNAVWIGVLCNGTMRLQPGDWHQCDVCGHVTED